jgi:hypothetical protein
VNIKGDYLELKAIKLKISLFNSIAEKNGVHTENINL